MWTHVKHIIEHLAHIDFVTAWKAISIALTGGFGILGLATEFRNKHTRNITRWGWVSLIGIIVSSVCGVAAQLKESHDDAAKALALATTSDSALRDIQRLLTPITDPRVEIRYEFDCEAKDRFRDYDDFCNDVQEVQAEMVHLHIPDPELLQDYYAMVRDVNNWKRWPRLLDNGLFLDVTLSIFTDSSAAKQFVNRAKAITPDLQMRVRSYRKDLGTDTLEGTVDENSVVLTTRNDLVHELTSAENMASIHDLPGTTLVITANDFGYGFGGVRPTSITITTRQGLSVNIPHLEKFGEGFRYTFPKTVSTSQSTESTAAPIPAKQTPEAK